jgi:hypothetical protein
MKPNEVHWSFRHRTRRQQVTGLTFAQAKFVVELMEDNDKEWLVWHEGLEEWEPFSNFRDLFASSPKGVVSAPMPPKKEKVDDAREFTMTSQPVVDKRLSRRFLKEYKVSIVGPRGIAFNTKTVNISGNGMLLKDVVPSEYGKSFNCKIAREDGASMMVFCAIVRSNETDAGSRLKFLEVSQPKVLAAWLVDQKFR